MKRLGWIVAVVCLELGCTRSPQTYVERGERLEAAGKFADAEIQYRKSFAKAPKFAEGYYRLGMLQYKLRHGTDALNALHRAMSLEPSNDAYGVELASVAIEAYQVLPNRKDLYEQASQEADFLLKKDPNSFDGLRLRGDVLVIDRKYGEAMPLFRHANAIRPNDPDVVLAMAQILFASKAEREAEQLVGRCLSAHPDVPPLYDLLEKHFTETHRSSDAEQLLKSEIAALPKDAHPRLRLAGLYRASGRSKEMSQELGTILADRASFPAGPMQVGDFYAGRGQWQDALAQYRAGVEHAPDSDKALYRWRAERALEGLGRRQEAAAELNEILKTNPQDGDVHLARAILARESPEVSERARAIDELKALAGQDPQNAVVHYNLAVSYAGQGETAWAKGEARKSAELESGYIAPRLLLGQIAQKERNDTEMLRAAGDILALDPNNVTARLLRVAALIDGKLYREAKSELDALAKLQPNSPDVQLEWARLAEAKKDSAKAEALYQRTYRPGSTDLRPLEGLLQVYSAERHLEKADKLVTDELKRQPDSPAVRRLAAGVATEEGKFDVAMEQYRWLQSKDPKSAQTYSAMGDLYQRQRATDNALASYEKASELEPNDSNTWGTLAILASQSGRTKQAIAALDKQLALDPGDAAAMNNLAFNLAENGQDLDRALTLAETVARKYPNNPAVIDTLGWVYVKRGLNQSAIQVLRGLVEKNPSEPAYRYHLGVALLRNKQTGDAKKELLAAQSEHPDKDLAGKIDEDLKQVPY